MQSLNIPKYTIKLILVLLGLVFLLLGSWQLYLNSHFRVVSTDPKTSNFASVSPFFKINFNETLSEKSISINSTPSIISSTSVSGKTLLLNINSPLNAGQNYTISISHVADIKGRILSNLIFSFVPKYIQYQALSSEQRAALLKQQTLHSPSKTYIAFNGISNLATFGLTVTQENALETAYYKFNQVASSVTIDPNSIVPVPHDPNSASTSDDINFVSNVDGQKYNSKVVYWNLSAIRLYLYSYSTGAAVYDSGDISG